MRLRANNFRVHCKRFGAAAACRKCHSHSLIAVRAELLTFLVRVLRTTSFAGEVIDNLLMGTKPTSQFSCGSRSGFDPTETLCPNDTPIPDQGGPRTERGGLEAARLI